MVFGKPKMKSQGMAKAIEEFNKERKGNNCSFCVKGRIGNKACAACRGTGKK